MKSVHLQTIISVLFYYIVFSDGQTTPFDVYAEVSVADTIPIIPNEEQKTYTTTIVLEKTGNEITFVQDSFSSAAGRFYSTALLGFVVVNNIKNSDLSNLRIQVTFDAIYGYSLLNRSVDGDDAKIRVAIGNLAAVRKGLNAQGDILSYYTVLPEEELFSFGGSSMCASASCTGAYVTCIEATDGISATCVSNCKTRYCGDDGICFHSDANVVPTCRCTSLSDLWVVGQQCETKFPLWLVVLLTVIGFLIILVVIVVVVICVRRKRRKQRRKEDILNSAPKSFQNNGFVNDEIRTTNVISQTTIAPTRSNPATSLARDDSFETVTSSEMPPSEYRPRSRGERRSYADSSATSTRHHHRHYDDGHHRRHRHHQHHRRRHSDDSTRPRESDRSRERSNERHQQLPPTSAHSSSDESDIDVKEDPKNLSYYEVEVNDLDLGTDAASSVVAASSTKSSPIRWLPPKDSGGRPGWVPSLGPMMYDLPGGKKTNADQPKRREGGTDV